MFSSINNNVVIGMFTFSRLPTVRHQIYETLNIIESRDDSDDNDDSDDASISYDTKKNSLENNQNKQSPPIIIPHEIISPHVRNYFVHQITNSPLNIPFIGPEECKHIWNSIDNKKYPNLLNHEFLATSKGQYLFEILLSQIGWYDSRFFSSDESLWLYRQVVFGQSNFRKAAAKTLYNRLIEKQVQEEEKIEYCEDDGYDEGQKDEYCDGDEDEEETKAKLITTAISVKCISKLQWEVPLTQIADVIVRIFGNHIIDLFLKDSGCFLAEHLWKICSDDMKLYICQLLTIRNCILLATDAKGNYIISTIIEWLHHQLKVKGKNYNAQLICWQWVVNWIAGDLSTFVKLCEDNYGVYVLKNFVKYCGITIQIHLLNQLSRHSLIPQLKQHVRARYIIKSLTFSCRNYGGKISYNPW